MRLPLIWAMACLMSCARPCSPQAVYKPTVMYLLNCGAAVNSSISFDSRTWSSDNNSAFLSSTGTSIPASDSNKSSYLILSNLLSTARIFTSPTSYSLPTTPGTRYWVRLYFYPFPYQQFDPSLAVFSITAGPYTLLYDIHVSSTIRSNTNTVYLFKEYSINATGESLVLTFIPNGAGGSYAFVNAIEVLSMPPDLFNDDTSPLGINSPMPIGMPYMALETTYRLNVGGPAVTPMNDTQGLFRTWLPNQTFLFSPLGVESISTGISSIKYSSSLSALLAPPIIYSTALQMNFSLTTYPHGLNLSYVLPVQAGYQYVVRLHFCDIVYVTGGRRVFNVYLQNQTGYANLDLGKIQNGQDRAYYRDFFLQVTPGESSLWIQAGPPPNSTTLPFNWAILNGIEVWKLNNSRASLDGAGVTQGLLPSNSSSKLMLGPILGATIGGMVALILILMGIFLFKRSRGRATKADTLALIPLSRRDESNRASAGSQKSTATGSSMASSSVGRHFTLIEMLDATNNFDESRVIGVGGFGKVYLGELDDGIKVAVKRGSQGSQQGITEFQTEIDLLSKFRHRHLVSLIGHCEEHNEMILVYEYMARGTLRAHLYGSVLRGTLPWKQRLEICIAAARGIHYLHTGAAQSIIHRDLKTTNILLDDNFVAKVSDFGLSKTGPALDQTHVSTMVKGSIGYLDPEYYRRQQLTEKSDIYSLGVVLLEVLCARPPINPVLPDEQANLAEWALNCKSRGRLKEIVDPYVAGSIDWKCLMKFMEIAENCLAEEGASRPTIGDVLWSLEHALQLQEASCVEEGVSMELSTSHTMHEEWGERPSRERGRKGHSRGSSVEGREEEEEDKSVFSGLVMPQGR